MLDVGVHLAMCGAVAMISPVLTLSPETIEEDGVFRHPYLVQHDFALVADQEPLPLPQFAVCHTDVTESASGADSGRGTFSRSRCP